MKMYTGYPTGVPLGGIGTGMIELLTDGRPGTVITNGNWGVPIIDLEGCFFAVRVEEADDRVHFRMLQSEGFSSFKGASTVKYTGLYPVAIAEYYCIDIPMGMEVTAFSPMIPHDTAGSNYPGAVFIFKLKNMFDDRVKVDLYVSWEHVVGCGGFKEDDPIFNRTGNYIIPVNDHKMAGLVFRTPEEAKQVYPNALGEYALLTPSTPDVKVSHYAWNTLNEKEELLNALSNAERFGDISIKGAEGSVHPSGTIGLEAFVEPLQVLEIPVCLSWYMPYHRVFDRNAIVSACDVGKYTPHYEKQACASGETQPSSSGEGKPSLSGETQPSGLENENETAEIDYGHYYQNRFCSAYEVAEKMLRNHKELLKSTTELHRYFKATDLPDWLTSKIINDTTPLTANTILTKEGRLATLEASKGMFGSLGTMDQRIVAHAAYQLFYPEINRTELQLFAELQATDGHIPHFCGNVYENIGSSNVEYGDTQWPDLSCSFIFQCYRDLTMTGDKEFFNRMLPHIHRAYKWLKSADADGDGVPEGGSTWDVEHHEGLFSYTGTLWLAILRIMERIAAIEKDEALKKEAVLLFDRAQSSILKNLWNGEYFNKLYNPVTKTVSDEVFVGQLGGEWIVRLLGLESILPFEYMKKAIKNIYKLNGDKEANKMLPIKVKKDGRLVDRDFKEQAWPQYSQVFVDCLAIYLGMADEGLEYIKSFNDTICGISRTPWTTTLWYDCRTGLPSWDNVDRYMNCPSAWFILNAFTGFHADETEKMIIIGPALNPVTPDNTAGGMVLPLISTKYWAKMNFSQSPGMNRIEIKFDKLFYGNIEIKGLKLRGKCECISFKINGTETEFALQYEKGYTELVLKKERLLSLGKDDCVSVEYRGKK